MAAPRFSPAGRLLVALLVVYGTAAGLVVWLGPSLRFAASRLPGYLKGSIAVSEHRVWEDEAEGLLKSKRELDRARDLLERSLAVEPNASTQFLLGEVLRLRGNRQRLSRTTARASSWTRRVPNPTSVPPNCCSMRETRPRRDGSSTTGRSRWNGPFAYRFRSRTARSRTFSTEGLWRFTKSCPSGSSR